MSNDPTPWDLAMEAIEDRGCDCDGDPEDIADHTCIAGRCEYALLTERAKVDSLLVDRRADEAARKDIGVRLGLQSADDSPSCLADFEDAIVEARRERDAALAEVERLRALAQPRVPSCPPSSGSDATLLVWIEGYDGVWCLAPANDRSISSAVYDATCDEARKWDGDDCIRSFDTGSARLAVRVIAAWAREDGYHVHGSF